MVPPGSCAHLEELAEFAQQVEIGLFLKKSLQHQQLFKYMDH